MGLHGFAHGEFLTWMNCLSGAVKYLHHNKLLHRDSNPDNILSKVQGQSISSTSRPDIHPDTETVSGVDTDRSSSAAQNSARAPASPHRSWASDSDDANINTASSPAAPQGRHRV